MTAIKNVVLAGATGNLGPDVLNGLIKSGNFNVTVIKRIGSESKIPASVKSIEVDYNSVENLTAAFHGQDAVISNLGLAATPEVQSKMIDACVAAGVQRFLPSEFGSNTLNPKVQQLPVFGNKVKVEKYLEEVCKKSSLTYTYVINGGFLDWGLKMNFIFDLSQYKPKIYGSGDQLFSVTTTPTIGKAVASILSHSEQTKNRAVYIQDIAISQNRILATAKKLTPGKTWEPTHVDLTELKANADANVAKGNFDMPTMYSYLFVASFGGDEYGPHYVKNDNALLGIKEISDDEFTEIVERYLPKN